MKRSLLLASLVFSSVSFANQTAPAVNPCDAKKSSIQKEIEHAKAHRNIQKIAGLEKALSEVQANCTVEGVAKDQQEKLNKMQQKIDERMAELKKAESTGKAKKIEKAKKKLQEAEQEFQAAKAQ